MSQRLGLKQLAIVQSDDLQVVQLALEQLEALPKKKRSKTYEFYHEQLLQRVADLTSGDGESEPASKRRRTTTSSYQAAEDEGSAFGGPLTPGSEQAFDEPQNISTMSHPSKTSKGKALELNVEEAGGRLAKVFPAKEYISFLVGYKEFCLLRAKMEEKLDIGSQNPLLVLIVAASKAGFQTDSLAQFHQRCIDLDREVRTKICPDHHLDPEIAWFSLLEDDNVPVDLCEEIREWLEEFLDADQGNFAKIDQDIIDSTSKKRAQASTDRDTSGTLRELIRDKRITVKGKRVPITIKMLQQAREDSAAWPELIQAGPQIARLILTNKNGNIKCLTCHSGGRGKSQPKAGDALRGQRARDVPDGEEEYLHCGCPLSTALLELWITKTAASSGDEVPKRPLGPKAAAELTDGSELKKADFAMSPAVLKLVEASFKQITGFVPSAQDGQSLFQKPINLLVCTIEHALDELQEYSEQTENEDAGFLIGRMQKRVDELVKCLNGDRDNV